MYENNHLNVKLADDKIIMTNLKYQFNFESDQ